MKTLVRVAVLASLGWVTASPVLAQMTPAQQQEYRRNCTADYTRLCGNYQPGTPEVQQCFQRRIAEVSPRCQQTIAKFRN